MSKKQVKSERDADLPDWADEVTPSDEVMKKFYAPTGAFKAGPIAIQAPQISPAAPPAKPADEEAKAEGIPAQSTPIPPVEHTDAPALDSKKQLNVLEIEGTDEVNSLPSSPKRDFSRAAAPKDATTFAPAEFPTADVPRKHFEGTQAVDFEEFVKKWKRYLYPGQLAVMRELYALTTARGAKDCFTRYSEIAAATKMTRRNCINVMNSLVERGFVERLEVRNDATGKGIRLRIHIESQL